MLRNMVLKSYKMSYFGYVPPKKVLKKINYQWVKSPYLNWAKKDIAMPLWVMKIQSDKDEATLLWDACYFSTIATHSKWSHPKSTHLKNQTRKWI